MMVPAAYAQDDTETDDDEIVVTGIRQALKDARDLKRDADTAIDSITASDVGTLPDLSVAEALARVPGVVVQRFSLGGSEGDFPSPEGGGNLIRGLTLVRSELNGRETFSANGGRALDFGTIPPELIGAVDVYKNTTADLVEGGIGGTVNLRTLEPFDKPDGFAVISLDGTYTDLRKEWAPDASLILGDRWDGTRGEFGILGSISHSELKSDLHGFQIGQLAPVTVSTGETIAIPAGVQLRTNDVDRERQSYYAAAQWQNNEGTFKATGKYARIENDVDNNERTLEWFHDGESWPLTTLVGDFTTTPFSSSGIPQCNGPNDPSGNPQCENTQAVTGLYQSGVISNDLRDWIGGDGANFTNLGINKRDKSMTDDISLNVKWRPADQWYVNLDWHHTSAKFDRTELWGGSRFFSNFSMNADLDNPMLQLVPTVNNNPRRRFSDGTFAGSWDGGNPLSGDLSDPANSFLLFASDTFQQNDGNMSAYRADVEYEFDNDGWFDSVEVGVRLAEREQTNRQAGQNWAGVAPPWDGATGQSYLPFDQLNTSVHEVVDFSNFMRGGVVTGDNTNVVFVGRDYLRNYDAFTGALAGENLLAQRTNGACGTPQFGDWAPLRINGAIDFACRGNAAQVKEDTLNLYAKFNFGTDFDNGMSIDANVGLRYTNTDVSGDSGINYAENTSAEVLSFAPETAAYLAQADTSGFEELNSDDHWLPSLNVKWNINEDMLIRAAASKTITRPRIDQVNGLRTHAGNFLFIVDRDATPPVVTDVVPNRISVFGGNPDLKAIESTNLDLSFEYYFGDDNAFSVSVFNKDLSNNIAYGTAPIGEVSLDGANVPIIFSGELNQDDATVRGVEVAYTQFFDGLPGLFANTGIQANYTYIDSDTVAPFPIVDNNGDGLPDDGTFLDTLRYGENGFLGLSGHSVNAIGIYQDDKLEARLAYNWRSEYLSSYRDFVSANPLYQTARGYLDGSLKFDVNDSLQFRTQVANILNTKAQAEQVIDDSGQRFGRTSFVGDRRIKVGLRYQFD